MATRTKAYLATLPNCDVHKLRYQTAVTAHYDSPIAGGPWGYLCDDCFAVDGSPSLAIELIEGEAPERDRHAEARAAAEAGDFAAFEDAVGDGDPLDFL